MAKFTYDAYQCVTLNLHKAGTTGQIKRGYTAL